MSSGTTPRDGGRTLAVSLHGRDGLALLQEVATCPVLDGRGAVRVMVDDRRRKVTDDWVQRWAPSCRRSVMVYLREDEGVFVGYDRDGMVKFDVEGLRFGPDDVLHLLSGLDFEVATLRSVHLDWSAPDSAHGGFGFADRHFSLGWGCAFKGGGHRRLVSRRWLDHGPWLVRRGPGDTTLVQFHDLAAGSDAALAQAAPAHERMGISDTGGYLQSAHVHTHELSGLHHAGTRTLEIVVHGREVSQREMLDACAFRHDQPLGAQQPVEHIAYVFMEEAAARRHLHELWLRELQCWAIVKGRRVRLDDTYSPPPVELHRQGWWTPAPGTA